MRWAGGGARPGELVADERARLAVGQEVELGAVHAGEGLRAVPSALEAHREGEERLAALCQGQPRVWGGLDDEEGAPEVRRLERLDEITEHTSQGVVDAFGEVLDLLPQAVGCHSPSR